MTLRRPAAGRRVGGGMLRVDATRAIAKLRDFQLAEPTAWILEAIRAAVASGATSIDVQGDSNDIWLSWQGKPWRSETLPELLSELVSPSSLREGREFRLLATAINSALGLNVSYIDVYCLQNGKAEKVRYTPSVIELAVENAESTTLRALQLEDVAVPPTAGDAVVFIHLRRRMGVSVVRNFLGGQPPEFQVVRDACRDASLPIYVAGQQVEKAALSDIIQIPLGDGIQGFIALSCAPPALAPGTIMAVCEYGVCIVSYPVEVFDATSHRRLAVPTRVVIDADRMPTNASRSDVRRNDHPIRTAEESLNKRFEQLCELLMTEITAAEVGSERWHVLRDCVMRLLAPVIPMSWHWGKQLWNIPKPFKPFVALPLLQNAIGEWCPIQSNWDVGAVHTGEQALPKEMRKWVKWVPWLPPGDPANVLPHVAIEPRHLKEKLGEARRTIRARKRFLAHTAREPIFERTGRHWVRASLDAEVSDSSAPPPKNNPTGELLLLRKGQGGVISILFEGRHIEDVTVISPLPFRAILSDARIRPESDYHSVVRNSQYYNIEEAVHFAVLRCVEAILLDGGDEFSYREAVDEDTRISLATMAIQMACRMGIRVASKSPLANEAVWQVFKSNRKVSLASLRESPAIGVCLKADGVVTPPGRVVVLCVSVVQQETLQYFLEPHTAVVHYEHKSRRTVFDGIRYRVNSSYGSAALLIAEDRCRGIISWRRGGTHELELFHCDTLIERAPCTGTYAPMHIEVDGYDVIPAQDWRSVRDDKGLLTRNYIDWELALIRAFASALVGTSVKNLILSNGKCSLTGIAGERFVAALHYASTHIEILGDSLYSELQNAPIFVSIGGEMCSAMDLADQFLSSIEYLETQPEKFVAGNWRPLIASEHVARFAALLSGRECHHATIELANHRKQQEFLVNLNAHRAKERVALRDSPTLSGAIGVIEHKTKGVHAMVGIDVMQSSNVARLYYYVEERAFFPVTVECPLPFVAAVEISVEDAGERFLKVHADVTEQVVAELAQRGPAILRRALQETPSALATGGAARRFCYRWLATLSAGEAAEDRRRILESATFTDQRGDLVPLVKMAWDKTLRVAKEMADQRGDSVPLAKRVGNKTLRVAKEMADAWLGPADGCEPSELDSPIVRIAEYEFREVVQFLQNLHMDGPVEDCSNKLRRLQLDRRVERGLLHMPTIAVDPRFKRALGALIATEELGEIGFHRGHCSEVLLCREGEEWGRVELTITPKVIVAIDCEEVPTGDARLAILARIDLLVKELLESVLFSEQLLPKWLGDELALALCLGTISVADSDALAKHAIYVTTTGAMVSWQDLVEQERRFGGVWYTTNPSDSREPMADGQFAITLDVGTDVTLSDALLFWDADEDLALDEVARTNRSRPRAVSLDLSDTLKESVFAIKKIQGGVVQGYVAPLLPGEHAKRGVWAHSEMQPIGHGTDPCVWPTVSIIEDAQLVPNRTWSAPLEDECWAGACTIIVKASDNALGLHIPRPKHAVTSYWVGRYVDSMAPSYLQSKIAVRGRLWLTDDTGPGEVIVVGNGGRSSHQPKTRLPWGEEDVELPVHGELWCWAPEGVALSADSIVQEVVKLLYPRLLVQISGIKKMDADLRASHLAIGLATNATTAEIAANVSFSCFSPRYVAAQVELLAETDDPIFVKEKGAVDLKQTGSVLIDDGTELSRAMLRIFAQRIQVVQPPVIVTDWKDTEHTSNQRSAIHLGEVSVPGLKPAFASADAFPGPFPGASFPSNAQQHALSTLVDALYERLAELGVQKYFHGIQIATELEAPSLRLEEGQLIVAGKNLLLLSLCATYSEGAPHWDSALEFLCMHALTILNQGHSALTDASEAALLATVLSP